MKAEDVARHELIGLHLRVDRHADPGHEDVEGDVVWETRQTLEVDVGGSTKTVPKSGATFVFEAEDGVARVDGNALVAAPADRTREKYEVTRCRA